MQFIVCFMQNDIHRFEIHRMNQIKSVAELSAPPFIAIVYVAEQVHLYNSAVIDSVAWLTRAV